MKLYDYPPAPNPRIVNTFIAEKGIEIEKVFVDLGKGEHLQPPFSEKNPMCDLPLLELDDGTCISQILAICTTLESLFPENPLLGTEPAERGQIAMWHHIIFTCGLAGVADTFRNSAESFKGRAFTGPRNYDQIPALIDRGVQRVNAMFEDLNTRLDGRNFIATDNFSMADITGVVLVDFAKWIKVGIPEDHTHLQRWYDQVSSREAVIKAAG